MMKDGRHDVLVGRSWQHLTGNEVCRARGNDEHVAVLVHVHAVNAHAFRLRDASMQRRAAVEDRLLATAHVRARCATVIGVTTRSQSSLRLLIRRLIAACT